MPIIQSKSTCTRRAAVLVWFVLCLPVVVAILAICLDGGRLFQERRQVQNATDAAAYAAGIELYKQGLSSTSDPDAVVKAARNVASLNGYAHDGVNTIVSVNNPPTTGDFVGQANYVEVVIETKLRGTFGQLLTQNPISVRARATVQGQSQGASIIVLHPTKKDALFVTGNGQIDLSGGDVQVNSNSAVAFRQAGNNSTITADSIDVTGGYSESNPGAIQADITTGVPPQPDPLVSVPSPQTNPTLFGLIQSLVRLVLNWILPTSISPGVYRGGIEISGQADVTMQPGIYILEGGFTVTDQASVTANGVMIYQGTTGATGPITFNTSGTIQWTPPSSGPYQGISIYQEPGVTETISITGNATTQIHGTIYAPSAHVRVAGNGTTLANNLGSAYIVDTLKISGNGDVHIGGGGTHLRSPDIRLAE